MGLRTVTWSLEVNDWRCRTVEDAFQCGEDLTRKLSPRSIFLLHDDNPYVLTILDVVLPVMKSRGFDLHDGIKSLSDEEYVD